MKKPKKEAAASTAATKYQLRQRSYLNPAKLSSLKLQIGEILLLLITNNGEPDAWQQFETNLREFYEVKI